MVSLIISGVFALFLTVGFFVGFKRGLKRSCIRGIWLAVTVILLLFLSTNITMELLGLPFGKWIDLTVDGTSFMTLKEYLTALLESKLALDGVNYAETVNVIFALISMAINGVVFLICFWILQLITSILYSFCNIFIFAKERREKKRLKAEGKKLNKHRLAGAFVGLAIGFVMFFCTVTPLVGYISVAKSVEKTSAEKSETGDGLFTELLGDQYGEIMNAYDNSVAGKVLSAVGLDKAMTKLLDLNSSVTVNNTRLTLSEEAGKIVEIYYEAKDFEMPDLNTCSKEELNTFLNKTDKLVDVLFNSEVVNGCTDVVLPIAVKYARKQVKTDDYKPYVGAFINACFDELETFESQKTKDEVKNLVGLVRTLNDSNILLPVVQSNTGDTMLFFKNNLTKENSTEIVNALFKLDTANELAPAVVNLILGVGAEQVDYTYTDENTVTATALKEASLTILTSAVDVLAGVDKVDGEVKVELTSTFANGFGGMLDAVKGLISENNFKNVIGSLENKIIESVVDGLDQPEFLKTELRHVVQNLSEVTSFKATLNSAFEAYDIVDKELQNAKVDDKYDVDKMNFAKIGKALDTLENNPLFAGDISKNVLIGAIDHYSNEYEKQISETFAFTCKDQIKTNINNNMGGDLDICWETEFPRYKNIVSLAMQLKDEPDLMVKVKKEDDNTLVVIGEQLDGALKESIVFGGCDRLLVADVLQYAHDKVSVSTDEKTNNAIKDLLDDAILNVKDDTNLPFNWTQEFKHIKSMLSVDFDNSSDENIVVIAEKLDGILFDHVVDGEIVNKSKVIDTAMVNEFIVDYMDQVFGEIAETDDFYTSINTIKSGFTGGGISSYKTEFEALLKLKSCKDDVAGGFDFNNSTSATNLGTKIDQALAKNGVIVTKTLINDYLIKVVDSNVTLNGQYATIKTNVTSRLASDKIASSDLHITSYSTEFGLLSKLMQASTDFGTVNITTIKTATNSNGNTVAQCFDQIADSVLVGDAGYVVIKDALTNYKDDTENADYLDITRVVCANFDALNDDMNFAPNVSGTKTYTYVNLVDALDDFYKSVSGDNKLTGSFTNISSLTVELAVRYDNTLATLQNNIVVSANGALEIALFAMKKLQAVAVAGTDSKTYIDTYINYLNYVKTNGITNQPYNSTTTTNVYTTDGATFTNTVSSNALQINNPFEVVYGLITS